MSRPRQPQNSTGVQARRLHFGGALFKGHVRKQGVDAHRQTRPCGRRRRIGAKGEVSLDCGAGGGRGSQAEQSATGHGSVHGVASRFVFHSRLIEKMIPADSS